MNGFRLLCACSLALVFVKVAVCSAADRPTTGRAVRMFSPLDKIVGDFMDTIEAEAASLAVSKNGRLVYAQGFGWSDLEKSKPTRSDNTFRIASNTKPITAAIVKHLIQAQRISLSTPVVEFLEIKPYGNKLADPQLELVTIEHLLVHKGGWDRKATFDPMYRLDRIKKAMKIEVELTTTNIAEYMFAQPLQFTPGEKRAYSNFGYLLLGCVIEKATGKEYGEVVQSAICRPLGVSDIRLSTTKVEDRNPKEVAYPKESGLDISTRTALGGLTSSAPSLCKFLGKYWINGDLRNRRGNRHFYHFGSHPNSTTALMEQRSDSVDYVVLFNSRRNDKYKEDNEALRTSMNQAIDQIQQGDR